MKRVLLLLICLSIFFVGLSTAYAEKSTSSNKKFVFRNGITWNSTPEQIELAEHNKSELDNWENWNLYCFSNVAVSNFKSDLAYYFCEEKFLFVYYAFGRDRLSSDDLLYLTEALAYKYGEPFAPDVDRLRVLLCAVDDDEYLITNLANWQLEDGTYIALFNMNGNDCIMYFNEAEMLRLRGVYNTAGL